MAPRPGVGDGGRGRRGPARRRDEPPAGRGPERGAGGRPGERERPARGPAPGPARRERPEVPGRGERGRPSDRPAADRAGRAERSERAPRTERTPRTERAPRTERTSGAERGPRDRAQRPAAGAGFERRPGSERPARGPRTEDARRPLRGPARRPAGPRGAELVYGRNPVLESVRARRARRVMIARGLAADPRLAEIAASGVTFEEVDPQVLDALLPDAVHQGVAAELLPRRFATLPEVLARRPTLLVALDSVLDPQNLGAILRSAEAAGADAVVMPERRTAPVSPAAVKASSGASEHLVLCHVAGLAGAISDIRRAGLWCVALDLAGEGPPWEFDFTQPVCVVVGGEGAGVHRLVRERCDVRLTLPMRGRVQSLNASAAASAVLYEVSRQRLA